MKIDKYKINCRYPNGAFNLNSVGVWIISSKELLWGIFPYWKTVKEIPQLDVDQDRRMNLGEVEKWIKNQTKIE